MKLRVPFKRGIIFRERDVEFIFNIATLEDACHQLDIEFWQMSEVDGYDFALAVLYSAYRQGCKERYKKPKYNMAHATIWNEMMSRESREQLAGEMKNLMGKVKKSTEGVKKK